MSGSPAEEQRGRTRPDGAPFTRKVRLHDLEPDAQRFRDDVIKGLGRDRKSISPKYLYDQRGSQLFDRICEADDYYPTRTELSIMRQHVAEMAGHIGPRCMLIEYGSGSSLKTRVLLDHLDEPAAYVPIDISKEHLMDAAHDLAASYPGIAVLPICADFTQRFKLPSTVPDVARRVVYFPGSTIGNFDPPEAQRFLRTVAEVVGPGGGLLIGTDLKKDAATLEAAYDDSEGVTRAFAKNLLKRMNRELDADFELDAFDYRAVYNEDKGRVEMYLVSLAEQVANIDGVAISFKKGETIHTENSHKFTLDEFQAKAAEAGFQRDHVWTDADEHFAVQFFVVGNSKPPPE